ncbi:Probable RNA-directed DNA polymerase from transposon BS [Eumeta japonica]|uniref:Probable RNA-directed DNA polymerase from transposon BS n=1 Tax=Eumeta variegata TaxID=151549 RepID=A0A4C1X2L8_EUMVA|nr:Probable RNA-directed DNA polymerase from transposon BS [Eumeta japonica]
MRLIGAGVPQDSTLSPLLYSAYVNDISRQSKGVQLALFADETALFLRSNCLRNILPRLQRAIDELTQWFRLWRIEVNPDKSAFQYQKSKMSLSNKRIIYTTCMRPVMTYASPVFAHVKPDILYELQVVLNKFYRRAADALCPHCKLHVIFYAGVPTHKVSIKQSCANGVSMPDRLHLDEGIKAVGFRHSSRKTGALRGVAAIYLCIAKLARLEGQNDAYAVTENGMTPRLPSCSPTVVFIKYVITH